MIIRSWNVKSANHLSSSKKIQTFFFSQLETFENMYWMVRLIIHSEKEGNILFPFHIRLERLDRKIVFFLYFGFSNLKQKKTIFKMFLKYLKIITERKNKAQTKVNISGLKFNIITV
jgi:hypothetical protein